VEHLPQPEFFNFNLISLLKERKKNSIQRSKRNSLLVNVLFHLALSLKCIQYEYLII